MIDCQIVSSADDDVQGYYPVTPQQIYQSWANLGLGLKALSEIYGQPASAPRPAAGGAANNRTPPGPA